MLSPQHSVLVQHVSPMDKQEGFGLLVVAIAVGVVPVLVFEVVGLAVGQMLGLALTHTVLLLQLPEQQSW